MANISQEPPRRDRVYSREQVKEVTGWAEDAIRRAFQAGLRRTRKHGRVFVDGADLCDYLTDKTPAKQPERVTALADRSRAAGLI